MTVSLKGLRILNTRPEHQAQALSQSIREAGGLAIDCPTLTLVKTQDWMHFLPDLNHTHQALFISANAVHYCFKECIEQGITWPQHIQIIAIGQATAKALEHYQLQVHDIPFVSTSEQILKLPALQQIKNQNLLLFKGEGGRQVIEEGLRLRGAHVTCLSVYQRIMPKWDQPWLDSLWQDNVVDIILITSEQSLHHLFKMFNKKAHVWLKNKTYLLLSQRLATAAQWYGITRIRISHPEAMMNTLFDYVQGLTNDE